MTKIQLEKLGENTVDLIYQLQARRRRRPSKRLGMSELGHKCDRYLWLKFRWACPPAFTNQKLRLLETGHREEARVVRELKRIGYHVVEKDPETNRQFFIDLGHVGGMLDGKVTGVVEAPKTPHLLEVKTVNEKGMKRLQDKGLRSGKPEHWAQCQGYMRKADLERTLYVAVCKNTDTIYVERIKLDAKKADEMIARAKEITREPAPPAKMNAEYPPCCYTTKATGKRWPCDFFDICHGEQVPDRSCRTCCSATPTYDDDGRALWQCDRKGKELDLRAQKRACKQHLTIPPMLNAEVADFDSDARFALYSFPSGAQHQEG